MKRKISILTALLYILIGLSFLGCEDRLEIPVNDCDCDLVTTKTVVIWVNGLPKTATEVIRRDYYVNDCSLDGVEFNYNTVIRCE